MRFLSLMIMMFAFSGAAHIITGADVKFNDGNWHSVSARRIKQNGMVRVDGGDTCK